jgi:hypothetical protein
MKQGLLETFKDEKKKRKRGKRLNLVGGEDNGGQLFDSARVRAALDYQEEKDAIAIAEKARKDAKKMQIVENKKRKEEAQEKALQRQVVREAKAKAAADKLAEKVAKKKQLGLLNKDGKRSFIVVLSYKKTSNNLAKAVTFAVDVEVISEREGSEMTQTRTQTINLPARFKK